MPRYSIDVSRLVNDISPVAAAMCGYCLSIVVVVGSVGGDIVSLPLVCEQLAAANYPCGGKMALVHGKQAREIIDELAAHLQETDGL